MRREDLLGKWSNGALYIGAQSDWWLCFRSDGLAALSYETAWSSEPTAFTWELERGTLRTQELKDARPWHWSSVSVTMALEEMPVGEPRPVLRFSVTPRGPGRGPDHYAHVDGNIPWNIDGFLNQFNP